MNQFLLELLDLCIGLIVGAVLFLACLILAGILRPAHAQDRVVLLNPGGSSVAWSGAIYGPQNGMYDVIYTQADGDTLFVDSLEPAYSAPVDAYGSRAWYLQAWYMPSGYCNPFGCEVTYAWQCPAWSRASLLVINCRMALAGSP